LWDALRIPFGDIKTVAQLDADVAAAARALEMAKEMGVPEYWYESLVADGYIKSLKALYELGQIVKHGKMEPRDQDAANRYFRMYLDGLKQASDALPKWEEIRDTVHDRANYTGKVVKVIARLREQMAETAGKLGCDIKL
jgi:TPR repeat protein